MIGDILPDVLAECGLNVSSPLISASDFQMAQIRTLMNAAGRDINTRVEWSGALKDETLGAGSEFALPSDFQELAEQGGLVTDAGEYGRIVVDPGVWLLLTTRPSDVTYFHLAKGVLNVSPEITGGTLRYVSRNWLGTKRAITSNEDEAVFPEDLLARGTIWRWRRQKGLPYEDLLAEFEADLEAAAKADRGAM